jgi:hypothetical protein
MVEYGMKAAHLRFLLYRNSGTNICVYVYMYMHNILLIPHPANAPLHSPNPTGPTRLPASSPNHVGLGAWGGALGGGVLKEYREYIYIYMYISSWRGVGVGMGYRV